METSRSVVDPLASIIRLPDKVAIPWGVGRSEAGVGLDCQEWGIDGFRVALEPPIGDDVCAALRALGHDVAPDPPIWAFGGAQAIIRLPGGYAAGSDPRKDGMAVGW